MLKTLMSENPQLHSRLFTSLLEAPGGPVWSRLLESFPQVDIFLAGGAVRGMLSNRNVAPRDFDVFVGGCEVERLLSALASLGHIEYGPFGSPRWYPTKGASFYYDVIPIDRFVNGLWICRNITDVLNQFDFTVNAVAVDLRSKEFFDPQNGVRDIQMKIMRAVRFDYPDEPIAPTVPLTRLEVLWFRILHYAAALKLSIEPLTREWLCAHQRYEKNRERFTATFFPLHKDWEAGLVNLKHE